MNLRLNPCTISDLGRLVAISRTTFTDAFEKDNDPEDFKAYIDFAFEECKLLGELKNPDTTFYFIYKYAYLVGYLKLNENDAQTDIRSEEGMELERIYVLQDFQGQHIGQWMLKEVKKIASHKQKTFLWLGVWEKNAKAIKFYQNHGFTKFGTHPYYIGKDKQTDWLMRLEVKSIGPKHQLYS
ncbi:GNAT family N-acetyltransferase [Pricia sp.]|uniref:GNAT family N-acetyltransferase n=1 Tax=Pricia sp. TaxID=2268138 RepID=UPI0035935AEB